VNNVVSGISEHFQIVASTRLGWPSPSETAFDLFDAGDLSPGPDFLHSEQYLCIGRKCLPPRMEEDPIVVMRSGQCPLGPNPKDTTLEARKPSFVRPLLS
jgi:hypothetical protein